MTKTPPITVVHGATGTQGKAIIERLSALGHTVRAVSRAGESAGHEAVAADLGDARSLARAYEGADAVVVQLPLVFRPDALAHAEHVLQALSKAGVQRAVFNTGAPLLPEPVGLPYLDARTMLARGLSDAVPVSAVVAPAGPYMDNIGAPWSAPLVAAGRLAYPLPAQAPVPWVALDDVASVIAERLGDAAPQPVTVVAGPHALTGPEVAAELSEAIGRPVEWETINHEAFAAMLVPHLGQEAGAGVAAAYAPPPPDAPPPPLPDPSLVRPGATTVRDWAAGRAWPAVPPLSGGDGRR